MSISQVAICQLAQAKVGHTNFITDLGEASKDAILLNVLYEPLRQSILRQYLWRFARKRAILAPITDTVPFDGGNYFQMPSDCLRAVGTGDSYAQGYGRWIVEGNRIIADTDTLELIYVGDIRDTALFDPIFTEVFAIKLADNLAVPLAQSQSLKDQLYKEFRQLIVKAAFVGATERSAEQFLAEKFIQVHY
jgi:hypothetical protein